MSSYLDYGPFQAPKVSASRRAYLHVKERILEGALAGTELLSENEVAEELGMSRTPVRAAFVQLEAEGYLKLYPKRGALVVPVSAQEAEAVMETRWVIERHAIERASRELGAELLAVAETHADLTGTALVDADRAFHRALVAGTGNEILLTLYDTLRDRQRRMARVSTGTPERKAKIVAEHRDLGTALADGDAEEALAILRRHLDGALAALRRP
jgi:DNA-binding GntR family transcriptional regulator